MVFHVSQLEHKEHYTAYWAELRYAELLRIEDTF